MVCHASGRVERARAAGLGGDAKPTWSLDAHSRTLERCVCRAGATRCDAVAFPGLEGYEGGFLDGYEAEVAGISAGCDGQSEDYAEGVEAGRSAAKAGSWLNSVELNPHSRIPDAAKSWMLNAHFRLASGGPIVGAAAASLNPHSRLGGDAKPTWKLNPHARLADASTAKPPTKPQKPKVSAAKSSRRKSYVFTVPHHGTHEESGMANVEGSTVHDLVELLNGDDPAVQVELPVAHARRLIAAIIFRSLFDRRKLHESLPS